MTYTESSELMNDPVFKGRVKVACLTYATAIMIEAASVQGHNARVRWATNCFQSPDLVASQVTPPTVMDPGVQGAGAEITDGALQGAVQAVVDKLI